MGKISIAELLKLRHIFSYSKVVAMMDHLKMTYDKKKLKDSYENEDINQIFAPSAFTKKKLLKIYAPPYSYQIDLIFLPKMKYSNNGFDKALIIVDILSRKAWVYPLKTASMREVLERFDEFRSVANKDISGFEGDKGFDNKPMRDWCEEHDVDLYTDVAKDDHISQGDKLGIVDRFTRTIKKLINRYVIANDDPKWVEHIDNITRMYNDMPHSGLGNKTPNEVYHSEELQGEEYMDGVKANYKKTDLFNVEDKVRIYEEKGKFDKEQPRWSREIYTVEGKVGNKYKVKGMRRKFKSFELMKIDETKLKKWLPETKNVADTVKEQKHVRLLRREGIVDEAGAINSVRNINTNEARPKRERKEVRYGS